MKFLSEHFVKIGVVALLLIGILIRDDLFPSDHQDAETPSTDVASVSTPPPSLDSSNPDAEGSTAEEQSPARQEDTSESSAANIAKNDQPVSTEMPTAAPDATFAERREVTNQDAEAWRGVVNDLAQSEPAAEPAAGESTNELKTAEPEGEVQAEVPRGADQSDATAGPAEATQGKTMAWKPQDDGDPVDETKPGGADTSEASEEPIDNTVAVVSADEVKAEPVSASDPEAAEGAKSAAQAAGDSGESALGLNDARKAFHEGRVDDAIALYHAVLDGEPGNYQAAGELGNVYMDQKEWDLATDAYALAAEILFQQDNWPGTLSMLSLIGNLAPKRAIEMSTDFSERRAEQFRASTNRGDEDSAPPAEASEGQNGDAQ
ncbi:MAG: tetratricopeptide repeat protein [Gammaproteobacteria bacterium]